MGNEDSDAIIGQTVTEYAKLGAELAKRLGQAESDADKYMAAFHYIKSRNSSNGGLRYGTPANVLALIPDLDKVKSNCEEIAKLIARRKELYGTLRGMNLEPKDPPVLL
ncbi:MAG TPA: hypothetical protein VMR62_04800 [Bryobacteraceae bacterium]|jgi:hypothetical protein|nr:hypothetical protein [Bryobacteraceae bacterium]